MQYDRYPFIDLAVHKDIRERFARGEALAVASPDLETVVWANGPAADLFGYSSIYEMMEDGIGTRPAIKRQISGAVVGLARKDGQDFLIRVAHGFRRTTVAAHVKLIELPGGAPAVLLSAEREYPGGLATRAQQIISGFDEGDAHIAVIDDAGAILAGSASFEKAQLSEGDLQRLARDVALQRDRLVKRMIGSARGEKPAAIGRLTDDPALNLVFVVETGAEGDDANARSEQPEAASPTPPPLPVFSEEQVRKELALHEDGPEHDELPVAFASARDVSSDTDRPSQVDADETEQSDTRFDSDPLWDKVPPQPTAGDGIEETAAQTTETSSADAGNDDGGDENASRPAPDDFVFDPDGRPVRFVWKIDRSGTFSELSPEFALAIGPNAADILGRTFPDVARVFNLDPDHVIADLLNRRDTWSGKTVYWPIQGTDLSVPVDLAALPTYTRERRFDGFRGFGIVRIGEARPDPEAIGLALVPGPWEPIPRREQHSDNVGGVEAAVEFASETEAQDVASDSPFREENPASFGYDAPEDPERASSEHLAETDESGDEAQAPEKADGIDAVPTDEDRSEDIDPAEHAPDAEPAAADDAPQPEDPFQGERPVLSFTPNAGRRESDKVIDLEARRSRSRESLSPLEQAAFREIGEKLGIGFQNRERDPEPDTRPEETSENAGRETDEPPVAAVPGAPEEVSALFDNVDGPETDDAHSESEDEPDANDTVDQEHEIAASRDRSDPSDDNGIPQDNDGDDTDRSLTDGNIEASEDEAVVEPDEDAAPSLPSRHAESSELSEDLIDMIPAALLVHAGDRLIHGNPEFFALTGFASLDALKQAGGLDILLSSDDETGAMRMRTLSGDEIAVAARLRSINWYDSQALLLSLAPKTEDISEFAESDSSATASETGDSGSSAPAAVSDTEELESDFAEARIHALEIEARELRSILETATDGVVIIGEDNRIRSMNGSAHALFGYDDTEIVDQPFAMLFAHESQRAVMDYLGGLAEHGVSSVLNDGREVIGREANGGLSPLFMTIGRLSGSNGYCAVLRDITQWKRSEEELREAKRAAETANSHKSDFLARVSHEIRTPLNAIIGFSEMMVEERFGPIGSSRYLEYAHDIGNSGKHVLDIVNDLLDISKIEAGEIDLDFGAVTLNDQLAECVSMLQPMANSQRVIIRTSLSASLPDVVADTRSIKQIALNLLSNAIRYTPSGGQIVVSTGYEPNGNVVLRIRDTGIGMSRKELEQAMKPFGQVGPAPRKRGDGTGLGLPLTKAMVEANRAMFDIVSAPKEGTLVTITFPSQRVLAD